MYFLRARYLNTNTGSFHSQDTYEGRNGEPITLHKYLYVHGNPAMFVDPSGNAVSLILLSVQNFIFTNFVRIGMATPTIAIGVRLFGRINLFQIQRFYQSVSITSNLSAGRYQSLVAQARLAYPRLVGMRNHHTIPIQLADRLAEIGIKIPPHIANITVRIPNSYHQFITNEINTQFPRGLDALGKTKAFSVNPASLQSVLDALQKVYEKYPLP